MLLISLPRVNVVWSVSVIVALFIFNGTLLIRLSREQIA